MTQFDRAAIVGLGLVGGSLARDLSERGSRIMGYDSNGDALAEAIADGSVSEALDASLAGVRDADLVVIAVPVDVAPDVLRRVAPHATRAQLVTDVGSTKRAIVAAATSLPLAAAFVGSHPMAGDHRSGWSASRPGLFRGARVYLCPSNAAVDASIERAMALWRAVDSEPMVIAADAHDERVAQTSHVPHLLSSALARLLARHGVSRSDLGPGGRDVTRLAGADPDLWTAIVGENADRISPVLAMIEQELAAVRAALTRGEDDAVREWLSTGRDWFDGH